MEKAMYKFIGNSKDIKGFRFKGGNAYEGVIHEGNLYVEDEHSKKYIFEKTLHDGYYFMNRKESMLFEKIN